MDLPAFDLSDLDLGDFAVSPVKELGPRAKFKSGSACYTCARPYGAGAVTLRSYLTLCEVCQWILRS